MTTLENRQWKLKERPNGFPNINCYEWSSSPVRDLKEGEFLVKNQYLSFDPTQRIWMGGDSYIPAMNLGEVVRSLAAGVVDKSRNINFPVGSIVTGLFGWQDYCISDGEGLFSVAKLPESVQPELGLSVLGITGLTAYLGMIHVAKIQPNDVVLVSAAAGATGSIAAQIAKNKGCKVIGMAGSEKKCTWLKNDLKLDECINYNKESLNEKLLQYAPNGINVYFDNVGGETLDTVLLHLSLNARVVLCGAISTYNTDQPYGLKNYLQLIIKRAKMEGFLVTDFISEFENASLQLLNWIQEGKLHFKIDIQNGLENAPLTLERLFQGKNFGKQLLKV